MMYITHFAPIVFENKSLPPLSAELSVIVYICVMMTHIRRGYTLQDNDVDFGADFPH